MRAHIFWPVQIKRGLDTSGSPKKGGHAGSVRLLCGVLVLLLALLGGIPSAGAATTPKLFQTLCLRGGGDSLVSGDPAKIANFDMVVLNRFAYDELGGNVWAQIKGYNPNILIYLYELGMQSANDQDADTIEDLNSLGRYNVSRGHPMGSLSGNQPQLFLLNASGNRIADPSYTDDYLMDFGSPTYQQYWVTAAVNDFVNQKWVADGIFVDRCDTTQDSGGMTPAKYPTNATWDPAMNAFSAGITQGMSGYNQKLFLNRGCTITADGQAAYIALDASATPPDAVLEEGAFVMNWTSYAAWFYSEAQWKGEIDLMGQIHHSKTVWESTVNLAEGASATDNYGQPVAFWDAFWYAMCSYLMGKNTVDNNSYFVFQEGGNTVVFQGELTPGAINLGNAVGNYVVTSIGGTNVYRRQYTNGYVYVNPTTTAATVTLPQAGKPLNHANYTLALASIPDVTSISLPAHRGVIVMNDSATTPTPTTTTTTTPPATTTTTTPPATTTTTTPPATTTTTTPPATTTTTTPPATTTTTTPPATTTTTTPPATTTTTTPPTTTTTTPPATTTTTTPPTTTTTTTPPATKDSTKLPAAPSNLSAKAVSGSQINLAWKQNAANETVTCIESCQGAGCTNFTQYTARNSGVTSTSNFGLAAGATYSYRVRAWNRRGYSAYSNIATATTLSQ